MITWRMANSTNIYERLLLHKWFAMLIWWKAQSLNLSIKASRKKDGKLKGISKYSIIEKKKSHLNFFFRNGCATSEDLFYKLDALQSFIRDLHWPDPEFAEHLNQRLKMMACDMIDSCIKRTDASFQNHLKKGILLNPTDYIVPTEICAMINVVLDAKNQSFKLCAVDGVDVVRLHFWWFSNTVNFCRAEFLKRCSLKENCTSIIFWIPENWETQRRSKGETKGWKILQLSTNFSFFLVLSCRIATNQKKKF